MSLFGVVNVVRLLKLLFAVTVVINVVLNIAFIPRYGIVGAAATTIVGYGVYNVLEVAAIYRAVGSHPFSLDNLKPLVPTLLFALGIVRLSGDADLSLPVLVGIGILISIVYLLSMVLTRSLGQEDLLLFERFEDRIGIDLEWLKSLLRSYY